jgi:hypothetical protein
MRDLVSKKLPHSGEMAILCLSERIIAWMPLPECNYTGENNNDF